MERKHWLGLRKDLQKYLDDDVHISDLSSGYTLTCHCYVSGFTIWVDYHRSDDNYTVCVFHHGEPLEYFVDVNSFKSVIGYFRKYVPDHVVMRLF